MLGSKLDDPCSRGWQEVLVAFLRLYDPNGENIPLECVCLDVLVLLLER